MFHVKSRKNFEVRRPKNFITLPYAKIKHTVKSCFAGCKKKRTAKYFFAVCQKKTTRQRMTLPCVFLNTLDKIYVYRVPVNLHTANFGAHGKSEISGSD